MHKKRATVQLTPRRDATRTALLDAAERMLGRVGYAHTTMEAIAVEAGVARRTAYQYFDGADGVILGTVDRVVDKVATSLRELAGAPEPAAARLERMLVARVMVRFDAVHAYHHALDELLAALRPAVLERRRAYFSVEAALVARVLQEGARDGELRVDRPRVTAELLLLCTNALLPHGLSAAEIADRALTARRSRAVAKLLVDGIRLPRGG
jgi:AcrR family transcriptional regulator